MNSSAFCGLGFLLNSREIGKFGNENGIPSNGKSGNFVISNLGSGNSESWKSESGNFESLDSESENSESWKNESVNEFWNAEFRIDVTLITKK